jgi:hypothetical protein
MLVVVGDSPVYDGGLSAIRLIQVIPTVGAHIVFCGTD